MNNSKLTTAKMVPFDLLGGNVELFYVNFDILTPRPHFMILPKDEETISQEFTAMSDEQIGDLMEASYGTLQTVMQTPFAIPGLILSLHRGKWFKKNVFDKNTEKEKAATFHAHLCVAYVNKYLKVFEANRDNPAVQNSQFWEKGNTPETYGENVKKHPTKKYFEQDVGVIINIIQKVQQGKLNLPDQPELPNVDMKIIFHPSHPKIGFVGKKEEDPKKLFTLLCQMDEFALKIDGLDPEKEGYHVCLYLGEGKLSKRKS